MSFKVFNIILGYESGVFLNVEISLVFLKEVLFALLFFLIM